jgi:hypothetical protein
MADAPQVRTYNYKMRANPDSETLQGAILTFRFKRSPEPLYTSAKSGERLGRGQRMKYIAAVSTDTSSSSSARVGQGVGVSTMLIRSLKYANKYEKQKQSFIIYSRG